MESQLTVCPGKEEAAESVGMKEVGLYNTTDVFHVSLLDHRRVSLALVGKWGLMGTIFEEMLRLGTKEEDNHITLFIYRYVLCVCVYIDTSALTHVHTHTCRPKANSRSYSSGYHSFCPTGTWNLVIQSGWLASELQDLPVSAPTVLMLQTSITTPDFFT